MADPVAPVPVPENTPAAPPAAAAVAPQPQPPPAAEVAPVAAVPEPAAPQPAADVAPAAEAGQPERTPSLLEAAEPPGEIKPEDKPAEPAKEEPKLAEAAEKIAEPAEKPADPAAPEAEKLAAAPDKIAAPEPPPAVEYKYELPEGLELNDNAKGELHGALDAYRADPANVQPLIDYHAKRLGEMAAEQHRVFSETKAEWRRQAMGDEIIGGSGWQTASTTIARVRDRFISDHPRGSDGWKQDLAAFQTADQMTGFGDHPAILKLFHRIGRFLEEPAVASADIKPAPQPRQRGATPLYDHQRSNLNGRE